MKIVEAKEVFEKLTMETCIGLMREAFCALETGEAMQPMRSIARLPHGESFGFMPAYLGENDCFGAKVLDAFPQNMGTKYPSHIGYVLVFESKHGCCVGMADAGAITQIRTGAASGVATDLLARKDARVLGIIGAGAQGRSHLEAMLCVRPGIESIKVYDINREAAQRFQKEMEEKFGRPVTVAGSAREAAEDSDIICTVTPSKDPYLEAEWVKPGAHINAVGTFSPVTREVTSELVARSRLFADQVEAMKKEAGEYMIPLQEGLITEEHIAGSLGQVLLGRVPGRTGEEEITLFDALGLAVEDVICGRYLCMQDGQDAGRKSLPRLKADITPFWENDTVGGAEVKLCLDGVCIQEGETILSFNEELYGIPSSVKWDTLTFSDDLGALKVRQESQCIQHQLERKIAADRKTEGAVRVCWQNQFLPARPNPVMDMGQEAGGVSGSGMNWMPCLTEKEYQLEMCISKDKMPEDTRVVWTFGEDKISRVMKKEDLQETFYYFGRMQSVEKKNFGYYWFEREGFDASEIASWTAEVFLQMAEFFQDDGENYKIFARARQCRRSGGTALKRSYSYIYDPQNLPSMSELKFLFPHEMVHNWAQMEDKPYGTCTWYVEGMAEFYCLVLPWRMGLASREELLRELNDRAEQYYENPCRDYPAKELGDLLFKDLEATTVPYGRGFFYLLQIDSRIREKTDGEKSLDDVMLALLNRSSKGELLQNEAWLEELGKVLDGDIAGEFEAMMNGAVIPPVMDAFEGADIRITEKEGTARRTEEACRTYIFI